MIQTERPLMQMFKKWEAARKPARRVTEDGRWEPMQAQPTLPDGITGQELKRIIDIAKQQKKTRQRKPQFLPLEIIIDRL